MNEDGYGGPGFTITRVVDAPRDTVWRLWTDPDELAHWFHPAGMSTRRASVEADVRVGGRYRYTMVADDTGAESPTGGEYLEVREPERLVFTWAEPGAPAGEAPVITVSLVALGARTEITSELRGRAGQAGDDSLYDGWAQALDHLAELAAGE